MSPALQGFVGLVVLALIFVGLAVTAVIIGHVRQRWLASRYPRLEALGEKMRNAPEEQPDPADTGEMELPHDVFAEEYPIFGGPRRGEQADQPWPPIPTKPEISEEPN